MYEVVFYEDVTGKSDQVITGYSLFISAMVNSFCYINIERKSKKI
jgi:hypothetical protein